MTEIIEINLPKLGESILGATVVQWLKKVGDEVFVDEALLEVSTDKVNSEIPSPVAGIVTELLVKVDQEIEVGAPLLKIEVDALAPVAPALQTARAQTEPRCSQKGKEEVFTPAVLRLAQIEGIPFETLRKIDGTGEGGRITKKDIESYLSEKRVPKILIENEGEDRIRLSGMRKIIADNMVRSFYEAPHASLVSEADVTDVMRLIVHEKERFKQTHGVKLTITSFLIQAMTKALHQFPMLNASLEDETIIMKRFVNVGIAVNVDKGLIVPVIKNCHERNLVSLARAVSDFSHRARTGKLSPDEVSDGTITLTNFGMTGALIGVPIIRYPEVAIIGAGTIQKRVVVRDDDSLAVRQMMYLTLTFDHRIIDGIYGCQFLAAFKHHVESISLH
jgi:2-oxoglutarate dehydrogenase E2 component (dihydrolipoamide succinyltransferase)